MRNLRIILLIGLLFIAAGVVGILFLEHEQTQPAKENKISTVKPVQKQNIQKEPEQSDSSTAVKADLYNSYSFYIPFVSIAEIAKLPVETKQNINNVLEQAQGCYFLKHNFENNEVFIMLQNPMGDNLNRYARHNLQIAKIESNGEIIYKNIGYCGEENEIENAVLKSKTEDWEFDESIEPYRPLKHTVYDKKKKILFSETWNYDTSNPVKYEVRDANDNVISVMKEIFDNEMEYRQEHIFYDEKGKIKTSLTINYNGADIKWFTYYDAEDYAENITIESIYNDGLKTEEKIYNQDYQLTKILTADYKDGEMVQLHVKDAEGKEISAFENQ